MAREGELTQKQAVFVKEYTTNGGNGTQAALVAYDTDDPKTASVIAAENLDKLSVRDAVNSAMIQMGIDANSLLKPIKDALEADTPGFVDKEGDYHEGSIDHKTRLKASELGLKLAGALNKDGAGTNVNINFNQHIQDKKKEYGL